MYDYNSTLLSPKVYSKQLITNGYTESKNLQGQAKRNVVFGAASGVFALYGYKRTTMQDIAQAVGYSRPALYLLFDNKESLFRELTDYRLNKALDATRTTLADKEELKTRIIQA